MANFRIKTKGQPPSPLVRPRPDENGNFIAFVSQTDGFSAYIHRDVLDFIEREARRAAPNEAIGLLAGRICHDLERAPYTLVMVAEGAIGNEADTGPGHVHISHDGRSRVRRRLEAAHPDREIIGWYHSHPHHEARFSPVDVREQSGWTDPNQVGIVFSATQRDEPFGVYRGPGATRLLLRCAEAQTSAAGQTDFSNERGLAERVTTERTQPGRPKLPAGAITRTRSVPGVVPGARFGRLRGATPRLLVLLGALGLAAGVFWLHLRVRSIETALGSTRGVASSSPTPAETPMPEQPSQLPDARSQASAPPQSETGSANRTALTDGPIAKPAANPLNGSVRRRNNARAGKSKKPAARIKNNKKREATNTRPAESRPVNQ